MFHVLEPAKPDLILSIMQRFREDARPNKVDVSVGVYKDEAGGTPIMPSVRAAEARLYAAQTSKTYLGILGDMAFNAEMISLAFGPGFERARIASAQTPGGSGALRVLADLIHAARPGATVHAPNPTWANHVPLLSTAGLKLTSYRYFDAESGGVSFDAMMADLGKAQSGDVVLLHGCCHNPTGADLDFAQWQAVAKLIAERGLLPLVDLAYLGLGKGLEEDAAGLRHLAGLVPQVLVAVSCSKNFSVYRERAGAALVLCANTREAELVSGKMSLIARTMYSMPPDHGAAAVRLILEDPALKAQWQGELEGMRTRIQSLRAGLTAALNRHTNAADYGFVTRQTGMFSRLPLTEGQADRLRADHAVYLVPDGRINIAGLTPTNTEAFARAYVATMG